MDLLFNGLNDQKTKNHPPSPQFCKFTQAVCRKIKSKNVFNPIN